jgi:hypothetical protein
MQNRLSLQGMAFPRLELLNEVKTLSDGVDGDRRRWCDAVFRTVGWESASHFLPRLMCEAKGSVASFAAKMLLASSATERRIILRIGLDPHRTRSGRYLKNQNADSVTA